MSTATARPAARPASGRGRSTGSGVLVGLGIAGFLDETVFHQLLHWHHFWDGGSAGAGLVSDGLFHAGSWIALVAGLFWYADLRRRRTDSTRGWIAGMLLGAGAFQLYDGLIQHKLFHLHQIRYHVRIWPYDVTWNIIAALLLLVGALLLVRRKRP